MAEFPLRHGISRARFFLQKAVACKVDQRDKFEAYLDAAIIFARTALLRLEPAYKHHPAWKKWWADLLTDPITSPAVQFFREERNWIIHKAPAQINQVIRVGASPVSAAELYYYETPEIPATKTVERHLNSMESIALDAERRFS